MRFYKNKLIEKYLQDITNETLDEIIKITSRTLTSLKSEISKLKIEGKNNELKETYFAYVVIKEFQYFLLNKKPSDSPKSYYFRKFKWIVERLIVNRELDESLRQYL